MSKHPWLDRRRGRINRQLPRRGGFILLLVLVVVAMATLAALNFSRSMLLTHEASRISAGRLQSRMCAESGAQAVRLLVAYPRTERLALGGTWENPTMFQAINIIPDVDPARRGNYTILAPSLDEFGNYTGIRYGLQNESAKLNLNTLAQLDALVASGSLGTAAAGQGADELSGGGEAAGGAAAMTSALSSLASEATTSMSSSLTSGILMALPGMTEEVADAILDWLDEDEEPRPLGAEFADYYMNMQPPYKPANGRIESIEQLLLVRGVTPQMLFGYDENRNGVLDQAESTKMSMGLQAGMAPGAVAAVTDPNIMPPPALGWAPYLTLQSQEKNVATDGSPRVNINADDMQLLYEELSAVLQNEEWASFIVAYRYGGKPGGSGTSPLVALAGMAAADSEQTDGAMGAQLGAQLGALTAKQAGGGGAAGGQAAQTRPWTSSALSAVDLTQAGSVKFSQVLDLFDATVTLPGPGGEVTYSSPLSSLPVDMALSTPVLMDYLTTVEATAIPGRINIMECPQEILRGIPGLTDEVVDQILEARVDGSESPTRNFETWLAVEGFLTIDEMRAIMPLVTCGGDVFKAQIVGYMEGDAAFSRIEAVVSGAGDVPQILFFRRMDHLDRGFDISTLGQRFDVGVQIGASF